MSRQREWTRTVLEILRHDATLVALVVAFVVLCVGVFGILQRENAAPRAASIARRSPLPLVSGDEETGDEECLNPCYVPNVTEKAYCRSRILLEPAALDRYEVAQRATE